MSVRFGPARARRIMAGSVTSSGGGGGTNPPPILTNLSAYWDVVDSVISQADAAGRCRSISDLSGNGKTLQQLTAANQPTVVSAGTAAGYVATNGTNQSMQAAVVQGQPYTVYYVGSQEVWTINKPIWSNTAGDNTLAQNTATPQVVLYAGTATVALASAWPLSTPAIITAVGNGASSAVRHNSDAAVTGNAGIKTFDVFNYAAYTGAVGNTRMKAILVYNAAHSTAEQNQIITWATAKWSIV